MNPTLTSLTNLCALSKLSCTVVQLRGSRIANSSMFVHSYFSSSFRAEKRIWKGQRNFRSRRNHLARCSLTCCFCIWVLSELGLFATDLFALRKSAWEISDLFRGKVGLTVWSKTGDGVGEGGASGSFVAGVSSTTSQSQFTIPAKSSTSQGLLAGFGILIQVGMRS